MVISRPDSKTISAYPNPSIGYTYIIHPSEPDKGYIRIYNGQGLLLNQVRTTGGKTRIDLTNLVKGTYHVVYDSPASYSTINIIKQ